MLTLNSGAGVDAAALRKAGLAHHRIALPVKAPPQPGAIGICKEALPEAYRWIQAQLELGNPVLAHGSQGRDRTGLLLCYYLTRRLSISGPEALRRLRRVRPMVLRAIGWEDLARQAIYSRKVLLDRVRDTDIDGFREMYQCPDTARYISDVGALSDSQFATQFKRSLRETTKDILPGDITRMAIREHADSDAIGFVAVYPQTPNQVAVSFSIVPNCRRQGFASSALTMLLNNIANQTSFTNVVARTHADNQPSQKLLTKLGFRNSGFRDGRVQFEKNVERPRRPNAR